MKKIRNLFSIEIDTNRIYGLDIIRALSIFVVVFAHASLLLPEKLFKIASKFFFDGVNIFFVLSGFLIGGILIKIIDKKGINMHTIYHFWIRRWFRTLPNYYLILTLMCIIHIFPDPNFSIALASKYYIFSQNLFYDHPYFFSEAWSLSIEEWFYLLLPLFIFIVYKQMNCSKKSLFFVCITVIIGITLIRYFRYNNMSFKDLSVWDHTFRRQVITRLDSLMFGVLGSYIHYYYHSFWVKYKNPFFILGLLIFYVSNFILAHNTPINSLYYCVFYFTLNSMSILLILPFMSQLKSGSGLLYRWITYISLISYSMYLINFSLIQDSIVNTIPWNSFISNETIRTASKYVSYWILVISVSAIIYKYFEIPMTSLRERFKKD